MIVDIKRVEGIIERYGLNTTNRKREIIWNRAAVYNFMRSNGFSFEKIGSLMGKDHATVIHGLKTYECNKPYDDFKSCIQQIEYDLFYSFDCYDDVNINEVICMVNLENLISDKL